MQVWCAPAAAHGTIGAKGASAASMSERDALMTYRATVHSHRITFGDLRELLVRANDWKSGDEFAAIAADGERERGQDCSRARLGGGLPRSRAHR